MEAEITLSWETESGQTRWMIFDSVESVVHNSTAQVTEDPIENGTPIADHAYNEPDGVSIVGIVSNTPLPSNPAVGQSDDRLGRSALMEPTDINFNLPEPKPRANVSSAVGAVIGKTRQSSVAGVWASTNYLDRVREAFDILRDVKRNFVRIRIQTDLHSYENMLIRSLSVPETVEMGSAKSFALELSELITGQTLSVAAPQPKELRAKPPAVEGRNTKKGKPGNDPAKEDKGKKSAAAAGVDVGVDAVTNFFGL